MFIFLNKRSKLINLTRLLKEGIAEFFFVALVFSKLALLFRKFFNLTRLLKKSFTACPVVTLLFVYLALLFREFFNLTRLLMKGFAGCPVVALVFVYLAFLFRDFTKRLVCRFTSFNLNCERFYYILMECNIFLLFIYCFFLIDSFLLPRYNFLLFGL